MDTEELRTINKHVIYSFKNDYIGKRIKKKGLYEKSSLRYIRRLLSCRDGLVIFDVGANIGNHSLDFSLYANHVYAFEPVPVTFDLLLRNIRANEINNVTPINKALSSKAGTSEIFLYPDNIGGSGFTEKIPNCESVTVETIVGDAFCEAQDINRLDFIKIDVEGHEEQALRGLMKTIRRFRPIIMMEWQDPAAVEGIKASRFIDVLRELYEISVLGDNKDEHYWDGRWMAGFRRTFVRQFFVRSARVYPFHENHAYENVLLIPKG